MGGILAAKDEFIRAYQAKFASSTPVLRLLLSVVFRQELLGLALLDAPGDSNRSHCLYVWYIVRSPSMRMCNKAKVL